MVYQICGMSFVRVVLLYLGECVVLTVPLMLSVFCCMAYVILKKYQNIMIIGVIASQSYVYMVLFTHLFYTVFVNITFYDHICVENG